MVYRIVLTIVVSFCIVLLFLSFSAGAAQLKNRGLTISPAKQDMVAAVDQVSHGTFIVANDSNQTIKINLFIRQFSALDYTYNYKFSDFREDWVTLDNSQVTLEPGKNKKITFTATIPHTASPGGHYFAFYASANMSDKSFKQTAQVISLLFMKVSGKLIQTGVIENGSVPFLNTGNMISYKFDARNTGNVHYSAIFFGQLEGIFGKMPETSTGHTLMPGTVRAIGGSVPSPLLPGLYRLTYGYKTDINTIITTKTDYILFIPPWSVALAVILLFGGWQLMNRKRRKARA
jgi:hypothetical protein